MSREGKGDTNESRSQRPGARESKTSADVANVKLLSEAASGVRDANAYSTTKQGNTSNKTTLGGPYGGSEKLRTSADRLDQGSWLEKGEGGEGSRGCFLAETEDRIWLSKWVTAIGGERSSGIRHLYWSSKRVGPYVKAENLLAQEHEERSRF